MTDTYVKEYAGEQLLVEFGDGATPEVFATKALINTDRSINASAATSTNEVPRTDDPSAPAKTVRYVKSTDLKITGAGVLNAGDEIYFLQWLQSGGAKNVKYGTVDETGANGGWTGAGPVFLTDFQITGKNHEVTTCTLTLEQADIHAFTTNA